MKRYLNRVGQWITNNNDDETEKWMRLVDRSCSWELSFETSLPFASSAATSWHKCLELSRKTLNSQLVFIEMNWMSDERGIRPEACEIFDSNPIPLRDKSTSE